MFTKFTVTFFGVFEPFDEAILMNVFDGTGTEARIEEGLVDSSFTPTNSTNFRIYKRNLIYKIIKLGF
jgi:hypothetical protein